MMPRIDMREPIIPCPPRGYPSWSSVPSELAGPFYEWKGRLAVQEEKARDVRMSRVIGAAIWMLIGAVIGAGIAVAVMW